MRQPNYRNVFALAWPMTIKAIILHGTIVIDGYLVSPLGEMSLAAMGLAAAIAGTILGVIFAFSAAMQIRTAQSSGISDPVYLKSTLACGLLVSIAIGFIGISIIWMFGRSLVGFLSDNRDITQLAWNYLSVFTLVILGESVGQCLSSYFNGKGQTKIPLYSFCLSLPVNVTSSIVFIHGYFNLPAFGVAGAAMGSALAIGVQVLFLAFYLTKNDGYLQTVQGWREKTFNSTLVMHIIFSLPIAATFISATFAAQICNLIYARMSLNAFAAMTLIIPWNMMAGQISMQWTQATGIIVAQLLGSKASEVELDHFLSSAWRGAFISAFVVAFIFLTVCLSVDLLYSDLSIETRAIVAGFLPILLLSPFPRATNAVCGNTLRASGDTVYVMHIFLWSQWLFRVPVTALFVLYFEFSAFWVLAVILGEELLKFPAFHQRLFLGQWKQVDVKT